MLIKEKEVKGWFTKWYWGKQDEVRLAKSACFSGQGHVWTPQLVPGPYCRLPCKVVHLLVPKGPNIWEIDINAKLQALKISKPL